MHVVSSGRGAHHDARGRTYFFFGAVIFGAVIILYRIFTVALLHHGEYVQQAQAQYNAPSALLSGRGAIYFGGKPKSEPFLAVHNQITYYTYASGDRNALTDDTLQKLAPLVGLSVDTLRIQLRSDKKYKVIAKNISKDNAIAVNALKLTGVNAAAEITRNYVRGPLAAALLGFVGYKGNARVGQYGIEGYHDALLSGEMTTQDIHGNKTFSDLYKLFSLRSKDTVLSEARTTVNDSDGRGYDVVLSIDHDIQAYTEQTLTTLLHRWNAPAGQIIVQEPSSGEIIALVTSPSYDPNNYAAYPLGHYIDPAVQDTFEPGSSFKPVTMAAAIDAGKVTPETTYEDTGEVVFGPSIIHNYNNKANGLQTMRQVLEHSLNTGVIFAENKLGDDSFLNYIVGFGFGQKTNIDLAGEVNGTIANLYSGRKVNFATAAFGQGIAVTPIQLVNAYSTIANGGKLMWPHVVKAIIRSDGTRVDVEPRIVGQPITEHTSALMKSMLVDVVDKGFDKARVPGYDVAGKTGTAQIPNGIGGYLENDQFIHNFVGFAPAYNPRFTVLIRMDKPQGIKFAADSLSSVFGDLTQHLIHYYNIPPTRAVKNK